MKLYHGTNVQFDKIDLLHCLPFKDFGRGFYMTASRKRASERAMDKCDKEKVGSPIIYEYEIDESCFETLSVKIFDEPTEEWIDFILTHRNRRNKQMHEYDVVIGPVADDGVITSINLYEAKVIDKQTLIQRLRYPKPYVQYCFCTQRAIDQLHRL